MTLRDRPLGRRSPLYNWLRHHYDELTDAPINWRWMMAEILERGLTDRTEKPPSLRTAQQTWQRVKADMKDKPVAPVRVAAPLPIPTTSPSIGLVKRRND